MRTKDKLEKIEINESKRYKDTIEISLFNNKYVDDSQMIRLHKEDTKKLLKELSDYLENDAEDVEKHIYKKFNYSVVIDTIKGDVYV